MKGTIWLVESHLKFVMRRLMNYSWVRMFTSNLSHGWWRERNVSESTVGYRRWPCINRTLNMWEIFVNLTCINSTPVYRNKPSHFFNFLTQQGLSWLYGSWVCNYLCNQWLITTKVVSLNHAHGVVNSIHFVIKFVGDRLIVFSTNKTDGLDITEILLKVALNIITRLVYSKHIIWSEEGLV